MPGDNKEAKIKTLCLPFSRIIWTTMLFWPLLTQNFLSMPYFWNASIVLIEGTYFMIYVI